MDRDAAIARALEENGMPAVYAKTIDRYLDAKSRSWICCGSGCDPCVLLVQRTVERAEQLLGRSKAR